MSRTASPDLEAQLMGDHKPQLESVQAFEKKYEVLENGDTLFIDENGKFKRKEREARILRGHEAMKFLGLPTREHNAMMAGDTKRIRLHFEKLFERIVKEGESVDDRFWDNIRVRVVRGDNAGHMTRSLTLPDGTVIASTDYQGDTFPGNALKQFLPELPKGKSFFNEKDKVFVFLISIKLTEEMEDYV